ncbi:MAG: hypothetical protein K0R44_3836 [Thermomicrobiales bacterium]|nr:hypothetical protein [Thermomicrobiales bacterium]
MRGEWTRKVALEDLDPLPVAFDDLGVDAHGIAGAELRDLWFELLRLELTNDLGNHLTLSFSFLALAARTLIMGNGMPAGGETAPRAAAWLQRVTVKAPGNRAQQRSLACCQSAGQDWISLF